MTRAAGGLAVALLLLAAGAGAARAQTCPRCLRAGAASVPLRLPAGTPIAGYGSFARRLAFPDLAGRYPHAFWFRPGAGELDPLAVRALVLETPASRLIWVTADLVAVDRGLTEAVERRIRAGGLAPGTLILSASHTHSGPGAFVDSAIFGAVALDRFDGAVQDALAGAAVDAVRRADAGRVEALVGGGRAAAPGVTRSRLGRPLDPEVVVLRVTAATGAPIALVWNYAIHGTMLGPRNLAFSGDVMGEASRELERALGVPALFVNGAVGDVSPARHGRAALGAAGGALARAARAAWAEARPAPVEALAVRAGTVRLPPPALPLRNCLARAFGPAGRWMPPSLTLSLDGALPRDARLVAAAVGDTAWVTIPGELQTSLGLAVRARARGGWRHAFVAGLSNDYLGYFVTEEDFERPTYVTCASLFGPESGDCLAAAAGDLLRSLRGRDRSALSRACDGASSSGTR